MATLIIEDLPFRTTKTDLLALLQPYGEVKSVYFTQSLQFRVTTLSATVEFFYPEVAENTLLHLDGIVYGGKVLRVKYAMENPEMIRVPVQPVVKTTRTAQVHVSYLTKQLSVIVTQAFLYEVFSHFGEVVEVSLKKTTLDEKMSIQNGYGFVHYPLTNEGINSALRAVNSLHQVTINQITYDCSISNQLKQVLSSNNSNRTRSRPIPNQLPGDGMQNYPPRREGYPPYPPQVPQMYPPQISPNGMIPPITTGPMYQPPPAPMTGASMTALNGLKPRGLTIPGPIDISQRINGSPRCVSSSSSPTVAHSNPNVYMNSSNHAMSPMSSQISNMPMSYPSSNTNNESFELFRSDTGSSFGSDFALERNITPNSLPNSYHNSNQTDSLLAKFDQMQLNSTPGSSTHLATYSTDKEDDSIFEMQRYKTADSLILSKTYSDQLDNIASYRLQEKSKVHEPTIINQNIGHFDESFFALSTQTTADSTTSDWF